jgi:hypothetical protein
LHKTVLSSPRASLLLITRMDNGLNRQYTLSVLGQRVSTKLPFLESEWTRHGGHLYVYDNESPELLHSMWLSTAPYSSMIVTKSNLLLGLDVHSKQIHTFILNSHCHSSKVPAKPQTKNVLNFLSESSFLYEMDDVVLVIDHIGASPLIISEWCLPFLSQKQQKEYPFYIFPSSGNITSSPILVFTSNASVGGAATEALTVTGILATDTILGVTQKIAGANNTAITGYNTLANNSLTVTWTANPGAGAVVIVSIQR